MFRETMKDCGRIGYRTKCEIDYEFKNIGSVPVLIKQVVKSCNCMEVSWDTQPVLPGATGHIHVVHKERASVGNKKGPYRARDFKHNLL